MTACFNGSLKWPRNRITTLVLSVFKHQRKIQVFLYIGESIYPMISMNVNTKTLSFNINNIVFFCLRRFPTNRQQRNLWLIACGLTEDDYKSSRRICSLHFEKDCFNKYNVRKCLYPGSVPTIFPESYNNHGYKSKVYQDNEF